MTTSVERRCNHCRTVYVYHPSGTMMDETNDGDYCPDCKAAILKTLESIPKKFEEIWVDYPLVTAEELIKEVEKRDKEIRAKGKIPIRPICIPFFDLQDSDNHNVAGYINYNGKYLMYSYWTKKGCSEVKERKQRNLQTGEITEWKDV